MFHLRIASAFWENQFTSKHLFVLDEWFLGIKAHWFLGGIRPYIWNHGIIRIWKDPDKIIAEVLTYSTERKKWCNVSIDFCIYLWYSVINLFALHYIPVPGMRDHQYKLSRRCPSRAWGRADPQSAADSIASISVGQLYVP